MRYIFVSIFFILFTNSLLGEDSLLTIKEQLDKLQREINDLSKSMYSDVYQSNNNISSDNDLKLTSIDLRIYDLEQDIKNLTLNFEEFIFMIDDLKIALEKINIEPNDTIVTKDKKFDEINSKIDEINEKINLNNNDKSKILILEERVSKLEKLLKILE